MRRPLAPLALAVLCFAAAPSRADEPPATFDLSHRDRWAVGDVVTTTVVERDTQSFRIGDPSGAVVDDKRESTLTATLVRKCIGVDLGGNAARWAILVKDWALDNGRSKDTSLAGARIEARGAATERQYGLVAAGPSGSPSRAARTWLDGEYGAASQDPDLLRRAWLPQDKVAVGATWPVDLGPILDGPQWKGRPVARDRATSTSRLDDVTSGMATVSNEATIPLSAMPLSKEGAAPLPWARGGVWSLQGSLSLALVGRLVVRSRVVTGSLDGEAVKSGKTISLSMKFERRSATTVGGDFPADFEPTPVPPAPPPMGEPVPMDGGSPPPEPLPPTAPK